MSDRVDNGSLATNAPPGAQDSKLLSRAAAQGPTRIRSLDVLRGVGVLGMPRRPHPAFRVPSLARWNPTAYGDLQGLNWVFYPHDARTERNLTPTLSLSDGEGAGSMALPPEGGKGGEGQGEEPLTTRCTRS